MCFEQNSFSGQIKVEKENTEKKTQQNKKITPESPLRRICRYFAVFAKHYLEFFLFVHSVKFSQKCYLLVTLGYASLKGKFSCHSWYEVFCALFSPVCTIWNCSLVFIVYDNTWPKFTHVDHVSYFECLCFTVIFIKKIE